ncbi:hypothetical protein SAMN05660657_05068 [Geodermatophilus amargosae]|uniref:Uncharacterized protein n=1 Tax=Geodermatophilus amargosae TaxID=1296565 RepID=A0A1I7CZ88_9ACTN|nr:hypothetical protein [Geodermatophilus amargosae]SFU04715.1 hypothetical protein SAMN05660657_05068 [Geodermatophilus amargosae]
MPDPVTDFAAYRPRTRALIAHLIADQIAEDRGVTDRDVLDHLRDAHDLADPLGDDALRVLRAECAAGRCDLAPPPRSLDDPR